MNNFEIYEYYHGWSEELNIVLMRRDLATGKRIKEIYPFEWYFYISRKDYDSLPKEKWNWLLSRWANKVILDPKYPDKYVRIYCDKFVKKINKEYIFSRIDDPNWADRWSVPFYLGERPRSFDFPRDRNKWQKYHHVVNWCLKKDIEPLEADISPKQRFLTDNDIKIQEKYHMCFFDIETDDTVGGFDNKEQNRILSIAWEGDRIDKDPNDKGFIILEEESDEAEKRLLLEFKRKCLNKYDMFSAWNGAEFDFPIIFYRFWKYKIRVDWRHYIFVDPLPIFKRQYVRGGSKSASFALDNIGDRILGISKIDWRSIFKERNPDIIPKFINLYRYEKELLEEYNRYDATILRKLEETMGFTGIEVMFCRIANGFPDDWNISIKIDQLLLKKGFKEGHHFRTRFYLINRPPKYEGAYVFPPVVGMHKNVAAFDFKSLYPSMVRAFNISPETLIKENKRKNFKEKEYCSIPEIKIKKNNNVIVKGNTTFSIKNEGYISQMFVNTLELRKKYTDLQKKRQKEVGTTQDDLYLKYYRLAYSYKRLGLSFYGDMGNPNSRYYDTDVAEAITLSGQYFIKQTSKYARKMGYKPLYGDTDSIFIQLAPDDMKWDSEDDRIDYLVNIGNDFVKYCQKKYLKILKKCNCNLDWNVVYLEFEDIYERIFFVTKKRYAGKMFYHKEEKTNHIEVKGLEVMRSDTAEVTRNLQNSILDAILMKKYSAKQIENDIINKEFDKCRNYELNTDLITISKSISKDPEKYKTVPIHVRLAEEIKKNGREFYIGMKIEYVVTDILPRLNGMIRDQYDESDIKYDARYYWDRVIYPASMRILEVVYPEIDWKNWLLKERIRREKLLKRYKKWFLDKNKVLKALNNIKNDIENNRLGKFEIQELKKSPRLKILKK